MRSDQPDTFQMSQPVPCPECAWPYTIVVLRSQMVKEITGNYICSHCLTKFSTDV